MKFCSLVLELHLPQNFCHTHTDRQTDRHFPEIVKSCSGHPKTCKSIKNRKSKICTKQIFFSINIEESKKVEDIDISSNTHITGNQYCKPLLKELNKMTSHLNMKN